MDYQNRKVIILVLNWNGWRDTLDCLESLYHNTYPDYHVVLIDNNSQDDSLERIRDWANGNKIAARNSDTNPFILRPLPYILYDRRTAEQGGLAAEEESLYEKLPAMIPHPLTIIQTGKNLGFAGGNNVGLRYARHREAEYVLLLNNDAMLRSQHVISTMIEFMETHPNAGACGGRLFYPDGSAQTSYGNFPALPRALAFLFPVYKLLPKGLFQNVKRANVVPDESIREPLPVDYPSGACFLVRNETINDVGLLDERFFMYAEETDWCLRMMKHGWGRYYVPQAEVVHKYAGSFTNSAVKMNRYFLESLFKYYRKNFTAWRLWILVTGYLLRSLYSILHGKIAACIMAKPQRLSVQDQIQYWRSALKLAATTMKDLITGNIRLEQEGDHPRQTR
jgi:GT2 family glycosyltransferase